MRSPVKGSTPSPGVPGSVPQAQRFGKRGAPQTFARKLYNILLAEQDLITWSPEGDLFCVNDAKAFARDVLTKYYRHGKFSSFQRQLNMYGFRKVPNGGRSYAHPYFKRDHPELLQNVRRVSLSTSSNSEGGKGGGGKVKTSLSSEAGRTPKASPKAAQAPTPRGGRDEAAEAEVATPTARAAMPPAAQRPTKDAKRALVCATRSEPGGSPASAPRAPSRASSSRQSASPTTRLSTRALAQRATQQASVQAAAAAAKAVVQAAQMDPTAYWAVMAQHGMAPPSMSDHLPELAARSPSPPVPSRDDTYSPPPPNYTGGGHAAPPAWPSKLDKAFGFGAALARSPSLECIQAAAAARTTTPVARRHSHPNPHPHPHPAMYVPAPAPALYAPIPTAPVAYGGGGGLPIHEEEGFSFGGQAELEWALLNSPAGMAVDTRYSFEESGGVPHHMAMGFSFHDMLSEVEPVA